MLFLSRPRPKPGLFFLVLLLLLAAMGAKAEQININTASLEELEKITGIGPVIGQRIIDSRPFGSVDDLIGVKGIGEKTLQKIKDQGLACADCQTSLVPQETTDPSSISGPTPNLNYPAGIIINEILPSPSGQDEKEEWIELFNRNDFNVDISFWQITDSVGQIKSYIFPEETIIKANGFLILDRPTTKITLNNSQDELLLIQPNGNITDSVSYEKALKGQSYSRAENSWTWNNILTPGQANSFLSNIEPENNQETFKEQFKAKQLADISQPISEKPSSVFLIALGLALTSGITILLTKKSLTKKTCQAIPTPKQ